MNPKKIAEKLIRMRECKELTQNDLAKKLEISPAAVSAYECGERIPRDEIKKKIAEFFDKTVQEIFFDD